MTVVRLSPPLTRISARPARRRAIEGRAWCDDLELGTTCLIRGMPISVTELVTIVTDPVTTFG
jgi:hypothetical protein